MSALAHSTPEGQLWQTSWLPSEKVPHSHRSLKVGSTVVVEQLYPAGHGVHMACPPVE